jgi:hypothetical protein
MRDQLYETIKEACENAEKDKGSNEADSKLLEQNNKLKYRITHLLRALDAK